MMRTFLTMICCMAMIYGPAQNTPEATRSFVIKGKVKRELTVGLETLREFAGHELRNVNTSCSPKKEERIKSARGVLLKEVLDSAGFDYEKGAHLNEFYVVLVAADGYKLVYSYNEIYNTQTGLNLYVVTELDGKPITELPNALLILTTSDIKGGRRNMKWLKEVRVMRAE